MSISNIVLVLATIVLKDVQSDRSAIFPIGGLFNQLTLQRSLVSFNSTVSLGSKAYRARALDSAATDSYSASLELCEFTSDNRGVVALIDARPSYGICDTVCLLANKFNISHLSLSWQPANTAADDLFSFYYHPSPELISKAYVELIKHLQWDKFTILYEDDSSFIRLQDVINSWPSANVKGQESIMFRKLDPNNDNRETFKEVLKVAKMSYHLLDCDVNNVYKYMVEITDVENSTAYQSFILTNLNSHTVQLDKIPDLMANVSMLHLVKLQDDRWNVDNDPPLLENALAVDALNHLEKSIRVMQEDLGTKIDYTNPPPLCLTDYMEQLPWSFGNQLRDAILKTTSSGFTGTIEFDEEGKRKNFRLIYSKLNTESEVVNVGYWELKTNQLKLENYITDRSSRIKPDSKVMIATKTGKPYIFDKGNSSEMVGYAVDLIKAIYKRIEEKDKKHFEYEFYKVPDDSYGNPTQGMKKWNGLLGELIEHKAELAICDLTITSERNSVVDFSVPFMSLGISMLFGEEEPEPPDMFSFIRPLALDVWLYLATSYIIVSFILLICARMSQDDWVNPHPCNQNPENLQNIWSLYNCMWLTMGAIMTQGCDILPRAAGSRWITGMWWFFALIVTASYTANMSTFISNDRRSNEIKNVKDLSEQNKVSYGAVYNTSTYKFFKDSNDSVYQKIWTVMKSARPTVFTTNNEEGKDRVLRRKGKYVFFMESTAIEYFMRRNCKLNMVGPKLDSKEYGIAMPKNYPHKGLIDNAILYLQEIGELEQLKKKWWETEDNAVDCKESDTEDDDNGSLQMENTSGIFLVLGVGGLLGLIVAVIDFLLHAREICVKEGVTYQEALMSEWRASLNPRALHKPAAPPRSAPPSTATPSPRRERSQSRAVSVLRAASSFINFDEIY